MDHSRIDRQIDILLTTIANNTCKLQQYSGRLPEGIHHQSWSPEYYTVFVNMSDRPKTDRHTNKNTKNGDWNTSTTVGVLSLFLAYSMLERSCVHDATPPFTIRCFRHAEWIPKFSGLTSSPTTRGHVRLGLPGGRFQDDGGFCIAAYAARRWSSVGFERAT